MIKRFGLNPDNGYMYESSRGPWVRYVDHIDCSESQLSGGWKEEALALRAVTRQLRNDNELLRSQNDKDYWAWQGDGTDHLESMGNRMIVRIFAHDLRTLLAQSHMPSPQETIRQRAKREIDSENLIAAVDAEKKRLLEKKSLFQRLFPYKIKITRL